MPNENRILELASGKCATCETAFPLSVSATQLLLKDLPGWSLDSSSIVKEFRFGSYVSGLEFAYSLGRAAEAENHHPDMFLGWKRVRVSLSTVAIHCLGQNDFIMAAKAELIYQKIDAKT